MVTGLIAPADKIREPGQSNAFRTTQRVAWLLPVLFALFAGLWALRGVSTNNIIDTDAARHAMNGAFIRDLVASGQWSHPIDFGRYYYSRLPALSMPYHPPLFPVVEALFFQLFGVSVLTSRILVALFTTGSLFLLYLLVQRTHRSVAIAVAAMATFYSWPITQAVASDTMLEFPSLLLSIAALLCFWQFTRDLSMRFALAFAVLAGAAVWTKQHVVFLGAVPFAYILLARHWRLLKTTSLWVASALYAIEVVALSRLSTPFQNTGTNQVVPSNEVGETIVHHLQFYWEGTVYTLGLPGALLLAASTIAAIVLTLYRSSSEGAIYVAWAACAFGVLILLGPYDMRYMFYVYPPLAIVAYDMLGRAGKRLLNIHPSYIPSAAALLFFAMVLRAPANILTGPSEAAAAVVVGSPKRVLYCGSTDGNFVFAVRALDPTLRTVVISGEKLPDELRGPAAFEQFVQRYAVSQVIIEHTSRAQSCDAIRLAPPSSLALQKIIPITSSLRRWDGGSLSVYGVNNRETQPKDTLSLPIPRIGSSLEVKF